MSQIQSFTHDILRKGHIYICPSCTRNTILGCADVEDSGYTAAEYHTTLATCTVKDYEAYLAMVLKASQSNSRFLVRKREFFID